MKGMVRCAFVAAVLTALTASAEAQGALLVVDAAGGPGSIATTISGAIDLAQDGDVLLVRAGEYPPFTIEARTLVVVAEPGAEVNVKNPVGILGGGTIVRGISSNQAVVLEGLVLHAGYAEGDEPTDALRVEQCDGQVWIQDCTLESVDIFVPDDVAALQVIDCWNVLVVRSTCTGTQQPWSFPTSAGLLADDSRLFAYESSFAGGTGAAGAKLTDTFLFAEQTTIQGGPPYTFFDLFGQCFSIVPGGIGLSLNGTARAELLESTYVGGTSPVWCAVDGGGYSGLASALHVISGPSLSFTATSPTLDGQPTDFTLRGPPGDLGLVLVATSLPDVGWFGKFKGAIVTGGPFLFVLGPLPPSGELLVPLDLGDALMPGTGSTVFLQGGVLHAAGGAQLGDPAVWTTYEE
jgi:hypothetical protein